jgi:hypothetical protein
MFTEFLIGSYINSATNKTISIIDKNSEKYFKDFYSKFDKTKNGQLKALEYVSNI